MMDDHNALCVLHVGDGASTGSIKLFGDNSGSWQKVRLSRSYRTCDGRDGGKYQHVIDNLPENFLPNHGYHSARVFSSRHFTSGNRT